MFSYVSRKKKWNILYFSMPLEYCLFSSGSQIFSKSSRFYSFRVFVIPLSTARSTSVYYYAQPQEHTNEQTNMFPIDVDLRVNSHSISRAPTSSKKVISLHNSQSPYIDFCHRTAVLVLFLSPSDHPDFY